MLHHRINEMSTDVIMWPKTTMHCYGLLKASVSWNSISADFGNGFVFSSLLFWEIYDKNAYVRLNLAGSFICCCFFFGFFLPLSCHNDKQKCV